MPIYEFDCQDCGEPFEELVFSSAAMARLECPSCGSKQVKKKLSTIASRAPAGGSGAGASAASCAPGGT